MSLRDNTLEFRTREYKFNVTLYHDDDGEDGYANWWQVETLEGERLGRRDLLHAHGTKEFTRSETITVPGGTRYVVVRGHGETHGYGGRAAIVDLDLEEVEFLDQGSEPKDFTDYPKNQTVEMKSYSNTEFGFKISYPTSWKKDLPREKEEGKPGDYRKIAFRAHSTKGPTASVSVVVNELAQPATLVEFKQYVELLRKLFSTSGYKEIYRGEFAGFPAVVTKVEHKPRMEKKGKERTWKGKMVGIIANGYLYRVSVGAISEDFEEIRKTTSSGYWILSKFYLDDDNKRGSYR